MTTTNERPAAQPASRSAHNTGPHTGPATGPTFDTRLQVMAQALEMAARELRQAAETWREGVATGDAFLRAGGVRVANLALQDAQQLLRATLKSPSKP